ncbi:uncharacterized protein N7496_006775 [Penicillium cataractarum]|uniref:TauD/TfdA-like domain-containing protein n=1 Tax=Penicillium cataractarum TaxID=2100454 RepID=A0A9W9S261_9EURO|nr:uncharacterized protein N7496_006775 [Penicillium cataractarum]KAJ5370683.1 hypothetical protein N7496_006775 [Penicillium cataractarum]
MAPRVPDPALPLRPGPGSVAEQVQYPSPLRFNGALDKFDSEDTTPAIGREFSNVNIVDDLLNAPNSDELIQDLAITSTMPPPSVLNFTSDKFSTVSQRGVVFFRAQDNLTDDLQNEFGVADAQVSTISSLARKKMFRHEKQLNTRRYDSAQWHSDIQFEPAPADYTSLRLTQLPKTGGDTLWASGYELYDRFSPAYQKFFETLTATYSGSGFIAAAKADPENVKIYTEPRGNPLNVGEELSAVHPVVRTNPVTGWKSIYAVGPFPKQINELSPTESEELLKKFYNTILESHDIQVRFKWRNQNDIAIWDNRSAFHTATFDYEGLGERFGHRAVGIGEKPYLDPNSKSRAEAFAEESA